MEVVNPPTPVEIRIAGLNTGDVLSRMRYNVLLLLTSRVPRLQLSSASGLTGLTPPYLMLLAGLPFSLQSGGAGGNRTLVLNGV